MHGSWINGSWNAAMACELLLRQEIESGTRDLRFSLVGRLRIATHRMGRIQLAPGLLLCRVVLIGNNPPERSEHDKVTACGFFRENDCPAGPGLAILTPSPRLSASPRCHQGGGGAIWEKE